MPWTLPRSQELLVAKAPCTMASSTAFSVFLSSFFWTLRCRAITGSLCTSLCPFSLRWFVVDIFSNPFWHPPWIQQSQPRGAPPDGCRCICCVLLALRILGLTLECTRQKRRYDGSYLHSFLCSSPTKCLQVTQKWVAGSFLVVSWKVSSFK